MQRLPEADAIFYDRLVDPELLELARRDAERVYVGKAPGSAAWPQARIDAVIVAAPASPGSPTRSRARRWQAIILVRLPKLGAVAARAA